MRVEEVAAELGVSKSYAYKIVQKLNAELKAKGYLTISGRINRKYFMEKVAIQAVEQIEAKPLPLSSKVAVDKEDFQNLVTTAQKFVVQEKQEGKLKKLLTDAKKTIADLKAKIESLVTELSAVKAELAQYKSVRGKLRTADLEQENDRLRSRLRTYEDVII